MHYTTIASGALLSAAVVSATTIDVKAGASGLMFTPNNVTAAVGDNVQFTFYPANHNVVQASFANPCMPMNGGFYSGFMPTSSGPANKTFTITVNDTTPIWFYCGQGTHCESGMVGVINPAATGNKTITAFAEAAKSVSKSQNPTTVQGGVLQALSSSAVTPSGSSSASAVSSMGAAPTTGNSPALAGLAAVAGAAAWIL